MEVKQVIFLKVQPGKKNDKNIDECFFRVKIFQQPEISIGV